MRFTSTGVEKYTLRYLYDESNSPVGFGIQYPSETAWTNYYFAKNLQGDVIALYLWNGTSTGTLVATYKYDPWGKPIGIFDASGATISQTAANVAAYNPFRYRGYHYDADTEFYYLQSRYYDPGICRFINADTFASTGQGFLGCNMFAYCGNNPISRSDSTGHTWWDYVKEKVCEAWNIVADATSKAANATAEWVSNAWDDATTWVSNATTDAWNWISQAATDAWNWTSRAATDAWNWTSQAATDAWNWTKGAAIAVKNFAVDRFSTPEKAANTLSAIGFAIDAEAAYLGLAAAGFAVPTFGMSVATAGSAAAILVVVSLPFHGAAMVLGFLDEE